MSGAEVVVADSPAGRLGLTVCYDLRFPELYQRLRFTENCQVAKFLNPTPLFLFFFFSFFFGTNRAIALSVRSQRSH
jgi:hypothetical protein